MTSFQKASPSPTTFRKSSSLQTVLLKTSSVSEKNLWQVRHPEAISPGCLQNLIFMHTIIKKNISCLTTLQYLHTTFLLFRNLSDHEICRARTNTFSSWFLQRFRFLHLQPLYFLFIFYQRFPYLFTALCADTSP